MIANIILFCNLRKVFDYKIPPEMINCISTGIRVKIPFGKKIALGFTLNISNNSTIAADKLKPILEVIDSKPIFNQNLYKSLLWAAYYYKGSLGGILDCALPKYVKENTKITIPPAKTIKNLGIKPNKVTITLNQAQAKICNAILSHSTEFNVTLLEGVTGSGKTEIYLKLTEAILARDQQVLILIPEIGLTPQIYQRFLDYFPEVEIALLHSKVSPKQRALSWLKAKAGTAKIVIGTRTAAFTPLPNPGLFIIDEEHDLSFKQQENYIYNARDFLIIRGQYANCPILLGTATPSLETLYNVKLKKYHYYVLAERALSTPPQIEIVDIRHKKLTNSLSNYTINEINKFLQAKQQVLLFINRRGFAPIIKCLNCNLTYKCSACDANLVWHIYTNKLHCHHCNQIIAIPLKCHNCNHTDLIPIGYGTERIELLMQQIFPHAKITRIDRDSTRKKEDFPKLIEDILNQKFNLLIGTQMIAKGHHFPNLSLVVIMNVDHALFSSDFRSTERLSQLIIQVAGRAGRARPGKVLLETLQPEHNLILAIKSYNYTQLYDILFKERQSAQLPPFTYQILWKIQANKMAWCLNFLNEIKALANKFSNNETSYQIFGPIPAIMEKCKKKFHARLLFQSKERIKLHQLHDFLIEKSANISSSNKVKWIIDVDPKEL